MTGFKRRLLAAKNNDRFADLLDPKLHHCTAAGVAVTACSMAYTN